MSKRCRRRQDAGPSMDEHDRLGQKGLVGIAKGNLYPPFSLNEGARLALVTAYLEIASPT